MAETTGSSAQTDVQFSFAVPEALSVHDSLVHGLETTSLWPSNTWLAYKYLTRPDAPARVTVDLDADTAARFAAAVHNSLISASAILNGTVPDPPPPPDPDPDPEPDPGPDPDPTPGGGG